MTFPGSRHRSTARLAALGAALLASAPALARADDLGVLVWVVVIWPMGVLLALTLLGLGIAALAVKRPARRLGMAGIVVAAVSGVGYPLWVEAFADARGRSHGMDFVTMAPVVLLAILCFLAALRARRAPPRG